jgi:DNA end-binding protein Ku
MGRAIWKGRISFGLVSVPVTLQTAEQKNDVHLQLIDSRNAAPVRYRRVNQVTGEEVPWDKIVKGYEYNDHNYVLLSDKELEQVAAEMTRTVDIEEFVDLTEIAPVYFERPYYLVPDKGGEKGYILLRDAMAKTGKVGIAKVVIHTRQYLAAMLPQGDVVVLNLLRFHEEIRPVADLDIPSEEEAQHQIRPQEMELALQLINGMSAAWNPSAFRDDYRGALLGMIQKKIDAGQFQPSAAAAPVRGEASGTPVINLMDALKRSIAKSQAAQPAASKSPARSHSRRSGKKRAS